MKYKLSGDYSKGRHYLRNYYPTRLRRLCHYAQQAIDANANGWGNTHRELVAVKDDNRRLKAELDAINGANNE